MVSLPIYVKNILLFKNKVIHLREELENLERQIKHFLIVILF